MTRFEREAGEDAEARRLAVLQSYNILDTPPEAQFDRIARLVSAILGTPMAGVTLVDRDRQWFKAEVGIGRTETPRRDSFCSHTMLGDGALVIEDALKDARFRDTRLVTGEPHIRFYAGVPLKARDGTPLGAVCGIDDRPRTVSERELALLADLAQLVMEQLELRHAATDDGLTGVLRRSAFLAAADRDLALARRSDRQMACLMIDVDHFKAVNDKYGHATGDRVLVALTDTIRGCLRKSDFVGRLGGEEFCVLLADSGEIGGLDVAERLLRAVRATNVIAPDGQLVSFTVSIGGTEIISIDPDIRAVIARADEALYRAKADGRDSLRWRAPA
jgi:diguanylate cyclase (GGDEF)-like protein